MEVIDEEVVAAELAITVIKPDIWQETAKKNAERVEDVEVVGMEEVEVVVETGLATTVTKK